MTCNNKTLFKSLRYLCMISVLVVGLTGIIASGGGNDDGNGNGTTYVPPPWTWVSGDNTVSQSGVYGTKGTGSISSKPGARNSSVSWIDTSGNLWLFGGWGGDASGVWGDLNDLWRFTPSTEEWTWIAGDYVINQYGVYGLKGTPSEYNKPGAREFSVSWTDTSGNLWLFGGYGMDGSGNWGDLNDLWKYEPSTGEWTWVSGNNIINRSGVYGTKGIGSPDNYPGARESSVSWIDIAGNLWLFGGSGMDGLGNEGNLNDLWKFVPLSGTTGEWTWVSGNNIINRPGVYGEKGTGSSDNYPGSRYSSVSWIDASGNLWLFGGWGYSSTNNGDLNDLWKYESATGEWTWVSGDNVTDQYGVYGEKGTGSASNKPGAREKSVSWTDTSGNLWLFGGIGIDGSGDGGDLNDLWKFEPSTGEWTCVSGDSVFDQAGSYGTKGIGSTSNKPGARESSVSWIDTAGNLWLFGGSGIDGAGGPGDLNDLWKCEP